MGNAEPFREDDGVDDDLITRDGHQKAGNRLVAGPEFTPNETKRPESWRRYKAGHRSYG